jgi:hypothetical protein
VITLGPFLVTAGADSGSTLSVTVVSTAVFLVTGSIVVTASVVVVLNETCLLPGVLVLSVAVEVMATWSVNEAVAELSLAKQSINDRSVLKVIYEFGFVPIVSKIR